MSDLACIHSYEEMRFWLGGQLGWSWSDGTPRDYENWGPGSLIGGEDCLELNSNWNEDFDEKTWNDRGCDFLNSEDMGFVCKK